MTRPRPTRRRLLQSGAALAATGLFGSVSAHDGDHPGESAIPEVAEGYAITPFAPLKLPTSLTFGPGEGGPDLYATTISRTGYEPPEAGGADVASGGEVRRVHVDHSGDVPVYDDITTAAEGFNVPLGVAFDGGEMFVSDSYLDRDLGRKHGVVYHVDTEGNRTRIVDRLPNGLHNTNHMEVGPDGRLFITNGNSTDEGEDQGPPDVFPYSGSILAVDTAALRGDPAVLHWTDESGERIPVDGIADHPLNDEFNEKVDVVAHGFRNVFGVAFGPDGVPYTGTNGSQTPASQDLFYRLDDPEGTDYGYPYYFNEGAAGATGEDVDLVPNPRWAEELDGGEVETDAEANGGAGYPTADGLMGWHVCAVGLDFPSEGSLAFPEAVHGDAFIGECGSYSVQSSLERTAESQNPRNTGRKVTHVTTDAAGEVTGFRDFASGFSLLTDVEFGPGGAMYIADADYGTFLVTPAPERGRVPDPLG